MKKATKPPSLDQMAGTLHGIVHRCSDKDAPIHVTVWSPLGDRYLRYEMKMLRSCSVDHIQRLLMPLYEATFLLDTVE